MSNDRRRTMQEVTPDQSFEAPSGERHVILLDLNVTAAALDEHLERLTVQRSQVRRLDASVERNDRLTPMPAAVARFYDDLELRSDDELTRRAADLYVQLANQIRRCASTPMLLLCSELVISHRCRIVG